MQGLLLLHEILDAQLSDRHGERIGRIDALTLELREARPLRVATILIGGPVRAERIGGPFVWLGRAMRALFRVHTGGVSRIPFDLVRVIGDRIQLDVDRNELESEHVERRLARILKRIPGARGDRK